MHTHVVKRRAGHRELYDNHKVYASCYAACLNTLVPKEEAEALCKKVTDEIDVWVGTKDVLTSDEIFKEVTRVMQKYNERAAFMYATHRDIS